MNDNLYILEGKRKRLAEKHNCKNCGKDFLRRVKPSKKQKKSEYCSRDCASDGKEKKIQVCCFNCGYKFFRTPSAIKSSKHGVHFCSRKCKDFSQSLDGKCDKIKPPHYGIGNGEYGYRSRAKKHLEWKCKCGISYYGLLSVHHIDGNGDNNDIDNLEVVCPLCHALRHMKKGNDGSWFMHNASLTPINEIINIEKKLR